MTRSIVLTKIACSGLLIALSVTCFAPTHVHAQAAQSEENEAGNEGFEPLFSGKDLSGWVKEGDAGYVEERLPQPQWLLQTRASPVQTKRL